MEPPKVVLDTSAVFRPLIQPNSSHRWILEFWQQGKIKLLVSDATKEELLRRLRNDKTGLNEHQVQRVASQYLDYCETITIPDLVPTTIICRDETDQKFIELAIHGNAKYMVSRDPDLLVLKDATDDDLAEGSFAILTESELLATIGW